MLPDKKLTRTNFVDGIRFNPEQIQTSIDYLNQKLSLANIYGIGRGVLVGFLGSLEVCIEHDKLILRSGAAIDDRGDIILVEQDHVIADDITNARYEHRTTHYVYLSHESKLDDLDTSRYDKEVKLYYTIRESFQTVVSDKPLRTQSMVEVARFYVNKKSASRLRQAPNPFEAGENEIDRRLVPKIVSANTLILPEDILIISDTFKNYGSFLHEFGYRKSIHSMAAVAAFAMQLGSRVRHSANLSPWELYDMFKELLTMSLGIINERDDITNTAFWKNIIRLQNIFELKESLRIDYYRLMLNIDNSFFSKVILHCNSATVFDGDWENILREKKEEKKLKDFLLVGRDPGCDIVIDGDDIAPQHAKIYRYQSGYFIEDLPGTSGVYVNAERVDLGTKKFIRKQDYVVLGKNGRVVNLQNIEL